MQIGNYPKFQIPKFQGQLKRDQSFKRKYEREYASPLAEQDRAELDQALANLKRLVKKLNYVVKVTLFSDGAKIITLNSEESIHESQLPKLVDEVMKRVVEASILDASMIIRVEGDTVVMKFPRETSDTRVPKPEGWTINPEE